MAFWFKIIIISCCFLVYLENSQAQDLTLEQSQEMSRIIGQDVRFRQAFENCPADKFKSEKGLFYKWGISRAPSWETCKQKPLLCLKACQNGSSLACYRTARLLEEAEKVFDKLDYRRVFAFGCLVGSRSSCTNRGAGLRNAWRKKDPASSWETAKRIKCQTALFKRGCRYGAVKMKTGWGCAMLAQAFEHGEGVELNKKEALRLYRYVVRTTCQNKEDETVKERSRFHPACYFARSGLERLSDQ